MNRTNNYAAAIGERTVQVQAANAFLAGMKAALILGSTVREGAEFFDGRAEMQVIRYWTNPPHAKPLLRGDVRQWLQYLQCNSSLQPYRLTGAWKTARERFA